MAAPTVNTILPVPSNPLVFTENGIVTDLWYKFFVALWQRTGAQSGSVSATLDLIGSVRGGMLARFGTQWLEFVAPRPNMVPVLGPNVDVNVLSVSGLLDTLAVAPVGAILYRGNTDWTVLQPVPGGFLQSQGIGQAPIFGPVPQQPAAPATVATGLVATGTMQSDALALTRAWSVVATVAANTGVGLFNTATGQDTRIWNRGANALKIYPPLGGLIDALGTNNPYSLPVNKSQIISKVAPLTWLTQQLG